MARRPTVLAVALVLLLAACGGDDGEVAVATSSEIAATSAAPSDATTAEPSDATTAGGASASAGELPTFLDDFDRLCSTQVGYGGAAAYEGGPGPHPVVVLRDDDGDGSYIQPANELPAGWTVEEDGNFDDNSELAVTELVACFDLSATTPTGIDCEFDGDNGAITLELVDATYDVTVYAARSGEEIGRATVDAVSTDCPMFVFVDEGQTEYVNTPEDDDIVNALRPYVEP